MAELGRYLLFAGEAYYPGGGWNDFRGAYSSVAAAQSAIGPHDDWAHVVDTETASAVTEFSTSVGKDATIREWGEPRADV